MAARGPHITISAPEDDPLLTVQFERSSPKNAYSYSLSPVPYDGTSSGGYSTPISPYPPGLESFNSSSSSLHLPFDDLSLTEGPYNEFHSEYTFKVEDAHSTGMNAWQEGMSPLWAQQPWSDIPRPNARILSLEFLEEDYNSTVFQDSGSMSSFPFSLRPDVLSSEPSLQRRAHSDDDLAHVGSSWRTAYDAAATTGPFPSPSFLLEAPPRLTGNENQDEDKTIYNDGGMTLRCRPSAREDNDERRGRPRNSTSPSRRPSPYTFSPTSPTSPSSTHLTVPSRPIGGVRGASDSISRDHSPRGGYSGGHSREASAESDSSWTSWVPDTPDSPLAAAESLSAPTIVATKNKVASDASIKASSARRTNNAKFSCDRCTQNFTTNHNLKNHRNAHENVRNYKCERCKRRFTTNGVLRRHEKTCYRAG